MLRKNVKPSLPVASNEESSPVLPSLVLILQGKLRSNHFLSQSADLSLLNKEVAKAGEPRKVSVCTAYSLVEEFHFPILMSYCKEKPDCLHHRFFCPETPEETVKYLYSVGEER